MAELKCPVQLAPAKLSVSDDLPPGERRRPEVAGAPQGIELRHLRYFVAVADAGSFTQAAERMFIAQPTLSQQVRRLEEFIGAQLLHRRREGLQLTKAGTVLLDASRTVLVKRGVGAARIRCHSSHSARDRVTPDPLRGVFRHSVIRAALRGLSRRGWRDA